MNIPALELIQQRNSASKLDFPAPSATELKEIFRAALRAPDHSRLRPWRFIVIEGEARNRLGQLFVDVQQAQAAVGELPEEKIAKILSKPLRAPMIIAVVARVVKHEKIPAIEQILSAGCAAQNILLAAEALGYAGIWRTGDMAYHPAVGQALGLVQNDNHAEQIIGYLYLGTRLGERKTLEDLPVDAYISRW